LIKVKEFPRLNKIEIKGNKKLKTKEVEDNLDFYRGQIINPTRLSKGINKLKKLYNDKGYLLAKIDANTKQSEDKDKVDLIININEGKKVQIKQITFTGNKSFDDGKLKKQMKKTKEDRWWRSGDFKKDEYKKDLENILKFYRKNGFRDAEIVSDSIYYADNKEDMFINIKINEGVKYYFGKISFEGNKIYDSEFLKLFLGIREGEEYNKEKFEKGLKNINQLYYDRGYLYTQFNQQEIPTALDTVNVKINIVERNPVVINRIDIVGNTKTRENVIRRELKIAPGDTFSSLLIQRSQRDIFVLNYFANVDINVIPVNEKKVNIAFRVEEKSTQTANMSAGYSERDGIIGSLGISMNNLFGRGQRFLIDWQFGRIYRSFQISFTEPWLFGTPTLGGFTLFDVKRGGDWYGYTQKTKGGNLRIGRRFTWPDNYFRGDWIFEVSKNQISDVRNDIDLRNFLLGRDKTQRRSITQIISRDSKNRPEFPTMGSTVSLTTQFSGSFLGGTEDFLKNELRCEWYFPAFGKFVLYENLEAGFIKELKKHAYISPIEMFFMGGSALSIGTPLRGYQERRVGPLTSDGYPLGGKVKLKFTTELRFPISQNPTMYGLFFAEAGNNWGSLREADLFDLKRSVGVGIRIFMPMMGMMGIDLGYGFDNFIYGKRKGVLRPHFQFGRSF
ncbi:outer membrane protein assembly factor BamA, partial [candidate division KSB1 bacterium]